MTFATAPAPAPVSDGAASRVEEGLAEGEGEGDDGKRLIVRDDKGNPFFSAFEWTEDAIGRVLRVPHGFMRNGTQGRIENLAQERQLAEIDLGFVEAGIELGLKMMAEMVAESGAGTDAAEKAHTEAPVAARCPAVKEKAAELQPTQPGSQAPPLNEVSPLNELNAMRMLLTQREDSPEE